MRISDWSSDVCSSYLRPEEAAASPLATALFTLGDVTGVFFGRDFVSVTIAPGAEWADAKPDVLGIVMDHFLADMPLFHPASAAGIAVPAEEDRKSTRLNSSH